MGGEASDFELGRKEILTESYKHLVLLNGGACVALATFLKDAKGNSLVSGAAGWMLACFVAGACLALASAWVRFDHSVEAQRQFVVAKIYEGFGDKGPPEEVREKLAKLSAKPKWYQRRYHLLVQYASMAAFIVGCILGVVALRQGSGSEGSASACECHCHCK